MTFYFYDLETSGFNPRSARIMQFGGQRTDLDLKPIGQPHNLFIKLSEDILPDPGAVLVTGITPARTQKDGLSEAEFLKIFNNEIVQPDTIFVGFNSVRFDDEFMRFLMYRNFCDAYEWQWKDGRSRWDLLDATRLTRALRPEGIQWPLNSEGVQTNNLGDLAKLNKLAHANAHDAVSDTLATIDLAKLIKGKQPKLFDYQLGLRGKKAVEEFVRAGQPFIYTSGKYPSEYEKTTIVQVIANNPNNQGVLVYDLREDPEQFAKLTIDQLAEAWRYSKEPDKLRLPIKTLKFNRCPAVAPLSTLDKQAEKRLQLNMQKIEENSKKLTAISDWPKNILLARNILDKEQQTRLLEVPPVVDNQLYDNFINDEDKQTMGLVRATVPAEFDKVAQQLKDKRLKTLLLLYKARNFPQSLSKEEKQIWNNHCQLALDATLSNYFDSIKELGLQKGLTQNQHHLLDELKAYGESLKLKFL